MNSWPERIETSYQARLKGSKHYEHPSDLARFFTFVEECANDPENAPSAHEFEERFRQEHIDPAHEHAAITIQKHGYWYSGVRNYIEYKEGR